MSRTLLPIRLATHKDAAALAALKLDTFRQTFLEDFAIPYPADDLARFEAETYSEAQVAAELADPARRIWVVEEAGGLIAYAHAGPCKLPHPDVQAGDWEFCQLYVRRHAQAAGLGTQLLDHVLDFFDAQGGPVWLGVWSGNLRAQHLYRQRGFAKVGDYQFCVGNWRDDEFILRRPARAR